MDEWIDVNQELPVENQKVLLWKTKASRWESERHVYIGQMTYAGLRQDGASGDWHKEYSHWMPLPSEPKSAAVSEHQTENPRKPS